MIRSGLNTPTPAMPMPDFAVPYAAPAPGFGVVSIIYGFRWEATFGIYHVHPNIIWVRGLMLDL